MVIAESFGSGQLILLGVLLLGTGLLLRRGVVRGRRVRDRDVVSEIHQEMRAAERSQLGVIRELEVRLHDYGREVEGRIQTRIAVLDRLICEADRESERLQKLVAVLKRNLGDGEVAETAPLCNADAASAPMPIAAPLTVNQRVMTVKLAQAGVTVEQIAEGLDCTPQQVHDVLADQGDDERAEAA